jgi:acetyltransferase-like isoleucine patch superfamily enzyme
VSSRARRRIETARVGLRDRRARTRPDIVRGAGVRIGRDVQLDAAYGGRIVLGDGCTIGPGCRLLVRGGVIEIGPGAVFGERCTLLAHASITIGAGARLDDGALAVDFDHDIADVEVPIRRQRLIPGSVVVGPRARIGPGANLLRGITVGEGATVGAHAVVTHDVPAGATAEGVPARLVGDPTPARTELRPPPAASSGRSGRPRPRA